MFIKWLTNLFVLVLFSGCSDDGLNSNSSVREERLGSYKFDECIVKVKVDNTEKLSFGEYGRLHNHIVPNAVLDASKDKSFPLFQTDTTRSRNNNKEYYFFFADECEKKVEYVNSIMKVYFLSPKEFAEVDYDVIAITRNELPPEVGGYFGLWVDR